MSGRAGRRGLDERGIVILMVDEKISPSVGKEIVKVFLKYIVFGAGILCIYIPFKYVFNLCFHIIFMCFLLITYFISRVFSCHNLALLLLI